MRRLLVIIVPLALTFGAIDVAARIAVQHQLEQRVNSYVPTASARVTIHGSPFLLKLAGRGRIDQITAHASQVAQGPFVLDRVDVTVAGVRINRSRFLHERKLELVAIDTGMVTADMAQADFGRLVGVPVTLGDGSARVTVAGVAVTARVSISHGRLNLAAAGLPVSVPVPKLPMLPCLAEVRIVPGHLLGSCTFHEIPSALKIALR